LKQKYFILLYQKISGKGQIHGASFEKFGFSTYEKAEKYAEEQTDFEGYNVGVYWGDEPD